MTTTDVRTIPPPPRAATPPPYPAAGPGATWAVVDVVGHARHGGFVQLVGERNVRLWRVDVPITAHGEPETHFFPPHQIHRITPVSRSAALVVAAEEAEQQSTDRWREF